MTTATEAAQRAAKTITRDMLIVADKASRDKTIEYMSAVIAAEFAPLVARAEAADKLAEAIDREMDNDGRLHKYILDAYRAYRAIAAQEAKP